MDKAEFLAELRAGRTEWDGTLSRIDEERITEPGAEGVWSAKDVVAHVAWHEREMEAMLRTHNATGSDLWNLPLDERNAAIQAENSNQPLATVFAEGRAAYAALLLVVEGLADEDLTDPKRYRGMPADWVPWQIVAGNSYEHEREHAASLRKWLDATTTQH